MLDTEIVISFYVLSNVHSNIILILVSSNVLVVVIVFISLGFFPIKQSEWEIVL